MNDVCSLREGVLTIPAKIREKIGKDLVIIGFLKESIFIYPQNRWLDLRKKLEEELSSSNKKGVKLQQFKRVMFSQVWEVRLNRQGKILIPPRLRKHSCLSGSKIIITYNWERSRVEITNTKKG